MTSHYNQPDEPVKAADALAKPTPEDEARRLGYDPYAPYGLVTDALKRFTPEMVGEILKMRREGSGPKPISKFLDEKYNVRVSHTSLGYMLSKEEKAQREKRSELISLGNQKRQADLAKLETDVDRLDNQIAKMDALINKYGKETASQTNHAFLLKCQKEQREAIELKNKLTGKTNSGNDNVAASLAVQAKMASIIDKLANIGPPKEYVKKDGSDIVIDVVIEEGPDASEKG